MWLFTKQKFTKKQEINYLYYAPAGIRKIFTKYEASLNAGMLNLVFTVNAIKTMITENVY
jgi:hypothetical protein